MEERNQKLVYLAHISEDGTREQTVLEHLNGTAELAAEFARPFGGEEQARFAGMIHDIGKYSVDFQKRLHGSNIHVDHSTAGAQEAMARRQQEAAFAVAGHHSGLPDGGSTTDAQSESTLCGRCKRNVPSYEAWQDEVLPLLTANVKRPSNIPKDTLSEAFYIRMLFSCLVDADFQDTETFMQGEAAPRGGYESISALYDRLQAYIAPWWNPKSELNRKRCEILQRCLDAGQELENGLYTLTVPTGGGKTIASLAFALAHAKTHGKNRVIYVIPYTSIIDQTADVFEKALGAENVIEHHFGVDYSIKNDANDTVYYKKALATENWDAPVIVTTAVQFFESLYANRSSRCRKLHNIANSVVIFDEAQTLPVNYLMPCVEAIGQLVQNYSVTAVLCTATQPALEPLFAELAPKLKIQEIVPDTQVLYDFFRRTTIRRAGALTEEALAEQLNAQPQTLCVVNRRSTVQSIASLLEKEGCYALTTLLCPADRKKQLEEIRARLREGRPCRVVSTSLIEAGVDLDFPVAWREEAGLDSILQTAGRCNREGCRSAEESVVSIFSLEGAKVPSVIRQNVDAAHEAMQDCQDAADLQTINFYFRFLLRMKGNDSLDSNFILDCFREEDEICENLFATAAEHFHIIENNTVTVYIPIDDGNELITQLRLGFTSRSLYRQLGQYAVNVYPEHLRKLLDAGVVEAVGDDYILTDISAYDRNRGLKLDVETGDGYFA